MLKNHLTTAIRNFRKNQFYVIINVLGLAVGITACLVVYAILRHELRFDAFHEKADEVYRVVEHYAGDGGMEYSGRLPNALTTELASPVQFGEHAIPMLGPVSAVIECEYNAQHRAFKESHIVFTSSSFLKNLDFEIVSGAPADALDEANKVYLTASLAKKYFGSDNPIGQTLTADEKHHLQVVGIIADPPTHTNVPFDMLISYPTINVMYGEYAKSWDAYWMGSAYLVVGSTDELPRIEKQITQVARSNMTEEAKVRNSYRLQPLSEVHTNTLYEDSVNYVTPRKIIIGFILLSIATLLASILNFVNLATAQAVRRSKEVGIRKTLGGTKRSLAFQFVGETLILVVFATLLAFTIGQFFILKLNEMMSIVRFETGYDATSIMFAFVLAVFVGIIAGLYPALIISNYNPIQALNNQISLKKGAGKSYVRKGLVITQFVVANLLIITTIIVADQMAFVSNKPLGFDSDDVLTIDFPNRLTDKMPTILSEFQNQNFVEDASWCQGAPQIQSNWGTNYTIGNNPRNDQMHAVVRFVDQRYLDVFDVPLVLGRNITNRITSDTTKELLVNREFLERANVDEEEALGMEVTFLGNWRGQIIGVIENYHVYSLQDQLHPVILAHNPTNMTQINLKLKEGNMGEMTAQAERVFRQFAPRDYFESELLNEIIAESYVVENLAYQAFKIFAGLAIAIGIFGLYGLVSFMASSNRKSISIRKVFGASMANILTVFTLEYFTLMIIAFVLATPFAYVICREWLNGFEYQIDIGFGYFILAFCLSLFITAVTIGRKSFNVARSNPIDALRYE